MGLGATELEEAGLEATGPEAAALVAAGSEVAEPEAGALVAAGSEVARLEAPALVAAGLEAAGSEVVEPEAPALVAAEATDNDAVVGGADCKQDVQNRAEISSKRYLPEPRKHPWPAGVGTTH